MVVPPQCSQGAWLNPLSHLSGPSAILPAPTPWTPGPHAGPMFCFWHFRLCSVTWVQIKDLLVLQYNDYDIDIEDIDWIRTWQGNWLKLFSTLLQRTVLCPIAENVLRPIAENARVILEVLDEQWYHHFPKLSLATFGQVLMYFTEKFQEESIENMKDDVAKNETFSFICINEIKTS